MFTGVMKGSLSYVVASLGLITGSWFAAHAQPGAWSLNGCGTHFFGEAKDPMGTVETKWLCFFFVPVIPVLSYHVLKSSDHLVSFGERERNLDLIAFSGLGLHWPSIRRTALGSSVGAIVLCAVLFLLKKLNE